MGCNPRLQPILFSRSQSYRLGREVISGLTGADALACASSRFHRTARINPVDRSHTSKHQTI